MKKKKKRRRKMKTKRKRKKGEKRKRKKRKEFNRTTHVLESLLNKNPIQLNNEPPNKYLHK